MWQARHCQARFRTAMLCSFRRGRRESSLMPTTTTYNCPTCCGCADCRNICTPAIPNTLFASGGFIGFYGEPASITLTWDAANCWWFGSQAYSAAFCPGCPLCAQIESVTVVCINATTLQYWYAAVNGSAPKSGSTFGGTQTCSPFHVVNGHCVTPTCVSSGSVINNLTITA
jgi:hypothetical protein